MNTETSVILIAMSLVVLFLGFRYRNRIKFILFPSIKIMFLGQPREIYEFLHYEFNDQMKKYSLVLGYANNPGKVFKTRHIFNAEDFDPNPQKINIAQYGGTMVCFKNIDGEGDFRADVVKEAHSDITKLQGELKIEKRLSLQKTKEYGLEHLEQERSEESFHRAGALRDLKKLTSEVEIQKSKSEEETLRSLMKR